MQKLLFVGDISGKAGRAALARLLPGLIEDNNYDFVVVNGENATHGTGLSASHAEKLLKLPIDLITLGDHAFDREEIKDILSHSDQVIRPINYPPNTPGQGWKILKSPSGDELLFICSAGQALMHTSFENPFWKVDELVNKYPQTPAIVEIHAEATSERKAMGWFLDGRATAVLGTHTHIPTADDQILPEGTAYLSDVGMVGPKNSVLGADKDQVVDSFLHQYGRWEPPEGEKVVEFNAVEVEFNNEGRANSINRLRKIIELDNLEFKV